MSISRVSGSFVHTGNGPQNSLGVTLPLTPQNGHSLIACIGTRDYSANRTVNTISQSGVIWNRIVQLTSGSLQVSEIWLGAVGPSASTNLTISFSGSASANSSNLADVCEYASLLAYDLAQSNSGNGITLDTGNISKTTSCNELWIGTGCTGVTAHTSPTNGFTQLDGSATAYGTISYLEKIVSSISPATCSVTLGVGTGWVGAIAAFKETIEGKQNFYHIYPENQGYTPASGEVSVYDFLWTDHPYNDSIAGEFKLTHLESGGLDTSIYGALFKYPGDSPAVVTSHHLIVRKDFLVRGMVNSYEGVLALHGGYAGWATRNDMYNTSNPFVMLSEASANNKNKFEIRTSYNFGFGGLKAGLIEGGCIRTIEQDGTTSFAGEGDAFKVGDDCYLVDINQANIISIQGVEDRNSGGFWFGAGLSGGYIQKLYASGNFLFYDNTVSTQNGGLMPASAYLNFGGPSTTSAPYPWRHIYGRWIHAYDQFGCNNKTIGDYDSKDDLALIKGLKSKRVTNVRYLKNPVSGKEEATEVEEDVLDFSELDFLHLDGDSLSINNLIGFLYGCTKALTKKQDEYDQALLKLQQLSAEVTKLQSQMEKPN